MVTQVMNIVLLFMSAIATLTAEIQNYSISALGQRISLVRNIKGHWDGEEGNPLVDSYNGEKHLLYKEASKRLGEGTLAQVLLSVMGKPDDIKVEGTPVPLMPGPFMPSLALADFAQKSGIIEFSYFWRGRHDLLIFSVNSQNMQVISNEWYHALE
jgi:hypothetical protein